MKKILVLRFSSIGDIVLTTPVLRCLNEQLEDAEIHFATKKAFASILESNPNVAKTHVLSEELNDLISQLRSEDFDYVVDLHNNLRSRRVTSALGKPVSRFHKLNVEKWMMVNLKVNQLPDIHIVDRYIDATKKLGVKNDGKGLEFFIPPAEEVSISELPSSFSAGYSALVIGAKFATKKLPVDRLIELVKLIKQPIVLIGGPEDETNGKMISDQRPSTVFNACGKFNLNGSASLIKQANAVISHDTGMMHIAAALGKPIFSLWGNTIPEFGMSPYQADPNSLILQVEGLSCRPCSKIGYKECPKGHFDCMTKIDLDSLAKTVNAIQ